MNYSTFLSPNPTIKAFKAILASDLSRAELSIIIELAQAELDRHRASDPQWMQLLPSIGWGRADAVRLLDFKNNIEGSIEAGISVSYLMAEPNGAQVWSLTRGRDRGWLNYTPDGDQWYITQIKYPNGDRPNVIDGLQWEQ